MSTELKARLRTSAVLVGITLVLLFLDANYSVAEAEGLWLLPLLLFFSLGTAFDITGLLKVGDQSNPDARCPEYASISQCLILAATAIVSLSACIPLVWPLVGATYPDDCPVGRLGWIVLAGVAAVFLLLLGEMRCYGTEDGKSGTIERTCAGAFVSLYVGLPLALMVSLRSLGDGNWGLAALLTSIVVTKSADAGAYFTGKAIGKHKLIPRLSPKKTWEGLILSLIHI